MENEDDIFDVDFDPSELDNIDEDALLNETNNIPCLSPTFYNPGLKNSAESAVTSSIEVTPECTTTSIRPNPPVESEFIAQQISSTKFDDSESKLSNANSSDDEEERKSSPHDKFKSEQTETKLKRCAVERANIPDSLDNVKLPESVQSYNTKSYATGNAASSGNSKYRKDSRGVGTVERVFLNPHFKGSIQTGSLNSQFVWNQSNQNKLGQQMPTITSFNRPVSSVIQPPMNLLNMPPPTFPFVPLVMGPGSTAPLSLSQSFLTQGPPSALMQQTILKPLIDTSRPPPFLLNVAPIPEKAEWLGATEDFLKKIQSKEKNFNRYNSNRHAADHIRRKYGVNNVQSAYERRRRSSTSTTKSQDDDVAQKSTDDVMKKSVDEESAILAKHGDICDEGYLKQLAQQKILRQTFLKRKEWLRQMEISKNKDASTDAKETKPKVDGKAGAKCQNLPIAQNLVKSVKDRVVLCRSVSSTPQNQKNGQTGKQTVLERLKISSVGTLPKITETSPRRIVMPPSIIKRAVEAAKNSDESKSKGPVERKISRIGVNLDIGRPLTLQKSNTSSKIALLAKSRRPKY